MQKNFDNLKKNNYLCNMKAKVVIFILFCGLAIIICGMSFELAQAKKQLKDANELITIQHELIEKLGSLDAVNATISVNVNNRATFGSIKSGDVEVIADQVLQYTRKQLIEKDTLCKTMLQ